MKNKGFDIKTIEEYKQRMDRAGKPYLLDDSDENTDEYVHFFFVGSHEDNPVIYDAVMYTLRLAHESELFEIAEQRAAQHFPDYKKITYGEDESGNLETLDPLEEEIGLYIAEVIMELEEEESVKVKEHVDMDVNTDFGIALEVGLHVDKITEKEILKFIKDFNEDTIELDETLYSFQTQDDVAD